jgi:non-canonical (house-cleaning) NTP pyrophosphatase
VVGGAVHVDDRVRLHRDALTRYDVLQQAVVGALIAARQARLR